VAKGAERPLKKAPIVAESVHGEDGLGDAPNNNASGKVCKEPAWKLICRLARKQPKAISLITIGPLTNLALAIQNDPEGVGLLKEVVVMGGVFFNIGNVRPDAEFNVAADTDAAFEVVRFCRDSCRKIPVDAENRPVVLPENPTMADCGIIKGYRSQNPEDPGVLPLTFVGLDVTHCVLLRSATLDRAIDAHPGNDLLKFIRGISAKYMKFYNDNEGLPGCYLHDPLAVGYVINPTFLDIEKHIIQVETADSVTNGVIFPDDRPTRNPLWRNPADEVIGVARRVEAEAFEEFFLSRMIYG
jgi:inosine-uridine nucleoside N-ribohydrolase